jgi:hypothetical protein
MPLIGKCMLNGTIKVRTIMGKTMHVCRTCGLSHSTRSAALNCCNKTNRYIPKGKGE